MPPSADAAAELVARAGDRPAATGSVTVLAGSGQPADRWADAGQPSRGGGRPRPAGRGCRQLVRPGGGRGTGHAARLRGRAGPARGRLRRDRGCRLPGRCRRPAAAACGGQPAGARRRSRQAQLAEILRHEIVHVATRSPESPAPLWAVEGLAEWVALGADAGRAQLRHRRRCWPRCAGTARLRSPAGRCRLRGRVGRPEPRVRRGLAGLPLHRRAVLGRPLWAGSTPSSTAAAPLDEASRAVLGVGAASSTAGWRRFLVRQAGAADDAADPGRHQRLPAPDRRDRVVRQRRLRAAGPRCAWSTPPARRARRRTDARPRLPGDPGRLAAAADPPGGGRAADLVRRYGATRVRLRRRRPARPARPRRCGGPGRGGSSG